MPDSHPPEAGVASRFGEADDLGLTSTYFQFHYSKIIFNINSLLGGRTQGATIFPSKRGDFV